MPLPEPVPGLVLSYAYLWREEQEQGREEGIKDRPCVVVLAVQQEAEGPIVTVAPITHSRPVATDDALELPLATKQRLGLDDQRSWIVTTEVNRFGWPGPDLRQIPDRPGVFAYGQLPAKLTMQVRDRIVSNGKTGSTKPITRD